jgi:hypothetical protein
LAGLLAEVPAVAQAQSGAAQPATARPAGVSAGAKVVTLPTGDVVQVQNIGGRVTAAVSPSATGFATIRLGGDVYVIPGHVLDQLGTRYRLSDFDVTALAGGLKAQAPRSAIFPCTT